MRHCIQAVAVVASAVPSPAPSSGPRQRASDTRVASDILGYDEATQLNSIGRHMPPAGATCLGFMPGGRASGEDTIESGALAHPGGRYPRPIRSVVPVTQATRLTLGAALAAAALIGAPVAAADSVGFTSPSGNVGCILSEDLLRCDIATRDWSPPPRPADCPDFSDYGQGILIHQYGPASFVCAGDTALGSGPALPYGEYQAGGGMSCNSEPSGMRCSNSDGHGFTISRQAYTLF